MRESKRAFKYKIKKVDTPGVFNRNMSWLAVRLILRTFNLVKKEM